MTCTNCGNTAAYATRVWFYDGHREERCDLQDCGGSSRKIGQVVDAYFNQPGSHYGIYNEQGEPVHISSKSEKAYWMKRMNLKETGDRVRGARKFDPIAHRHAMESLRRPQR